MKHLIAAAAAVLTLLATAPTAQAQGNSVSFGVQGAYDLDSESLGLGGQLRFGANLGGFALVFNPNAEYYFLDDTEGADASLIAGGLDLLYQVGDEYVTTFQPYVGAGLGIRHYRLDFEADILDDISETDLGLNLIGGAKFGVGGPVTPFVQATLTIMDGTPVGIKGGILFGGQ